MFGVCLVCVWCVFGVCLVCVCVCVWCVCVCVWCVFGVCVCVCVFSVFREAFVEVQVRVFLMVFRTAFVDLQGESPEAHWQDSGQRRKTLSIDLSVIWEEDALPTYLQFFLRTCNSLRFCN